jgi:SHS2 domain-containing protein
LAHGSDRNFMPESCTKDRPGGAWEHFPHAADIGVRGFGASLAQCFEQAALALTAVVAEPGCVRPETAVEIHCQAPDAELLLVDWLNAIVYEMATRRMLFGQFQVSIQGTVLKGLARGESIDIARHRPAAEVKGATLSELEVAQTPGGGWRAQCIVDV